MSFLNPSVAEARRRRWIVGSLSAAATVIVMTLFLVESRWGYLPPDPRLIYFKSWAATRSRADTLADLDRARAARAAKLADSRAYIATLTGQKRLDAQKQYDAYVAGGAARRDIPYAPVTAAAAAASATGGDEPPVE